MSLVEFFPLEVETMPLQGRHLIEASAGTGKTFNITRIYLRLLLVKGLTVQQILVMTFTKDATEEIRARIDNFLRHALNHWQDAITRDPYFIALAKELKEVGVTDRQVSMQLKRALLFLDEASIYTIHGFCKTVLSQHAFATGTAFNANLEAQQQDIQQQAIEDWYRQLAVADPKAFSLVSEFWLTPDAFAQQFVSLIGHRGQLEVNDPKAEITQFCQLSKQASEALIANQPFLFEHLVDVKSGKEKTSRKEEYNQLIQWLNAASEDHLHSQKTMPVSFMDGRRFSRSKVKPQLVEIFAQANNVKKAKDNLLSNIRKLSALQHIVSGLTIISQRVEQQKALQKQLSFDDLIQTLADTLHGENAAQLIATLSNQFPFALVDEFQDTDFDQYRILNALYQHNDTTGLIMIGDPKQAIYGFRGGDIFTYMAARKDAHYRWRMNTNWRSSKAMITSYNRLFYGNTLTAKALPVFGYGITYTPVASSPNASKKAKDTESALKFVYFPPEDQKAVAQPFRKQMALWCAQKISALLSQDDTLVAKDIALLVRDGAEAQEIKQALHDAGLASVYLSDRTNLWHSEEAKYLIPLLQGIIHCEKDREFCRAMASPLLAISAKDYYQIRGDDAQWQNYKEQFTQLKETWFKQGFVTMALKLMHSLIAVNGQESERCLTNLLHLFELLQTKSQQLRQPEELLYWFEHQYKLDLPEQETELRLESEENLIKIVTQHGSKGLEYPVVFIPFSTRHKNPLKFGNKNIQAVSYHDEDGKYRVSLSADQKALTAMSDEAYAESIRLLYVAITRAEQRCYILATPFDKFYLSPLGKTLGLTSEDNLVDCIQQLVTDQPDEISLEVVEQIPLVNHKLTKQVIANAEVACFTGQIERDWWLSSFTALNRNIRDVGVSQPERNDDSNVVTPLALTQNKSDHQGQLRFALTKGAAAGNLLHDILENAHFSQPNWPVDCNWPLSKYGNLPDGFEQEDLYQWLNEIISTPLIINEHEKPFKLANIKDTCCLKEVEFYFPLKNASTKALTNCLLAHRKQQCQAYGIATTSRHFYLPGYQALKGMMHGFIDLVFEHQGKFYVCDYKSTHLGNSFNDYQCASLVNDIQRHHYDLQYLIYSVALHRYLKRQLPDYNVEQHFGGVFYLYLRGMEQKQEKTGVFYTELTKQLLNDLDNLFGNINEQSKVG
ncbi:exodeoxyribonuclease V subunit beta [Thalassotalea sediminis]|uniref:exodeoxyribonuclease V subunit beta n=1 Tax=Thalassotalea sediminis TaxID=1759089 RepID=UPI0025735FDD|nr:exodeoxyribonuclease V subunit beta [Thalassotalea sediminis]